MATSKTIYVMPNPYGVLDAKGMLAGGCQMAEERSGGLPANVKIGAKLRMVDGTYNDRKADLGKAIDSGTLAGVMLPLMFSRSELIWHFDAVEPVAIQVTAKTEGFYQSRFRLNGTPPCLLQCKDSGDLQLDALAEQRLDAIDRFKAAYGADPPIDAWKTQFELDETIADLMSVLVEKRKSAARKTEADAKTAANKSETDAKTAEKKRLDARAKLLEEAKKRMLDEKPAPEPAPHRFTEPTHEPTFNPKKSEK